MAGAFLMAVKRYAEYRMIGDPDRAGLYRKSFSKYTVYISLIYIILNYIKIGVIF